MLPNLLIVGAAKAGTTSLHHYLEAHPEVSMSTPKELNFWQEPDASANLPEYNRHFRADRPVRGESTPLYTYHPVFPGTAGRIHGAIPDAKLIYIMRDPVERAISHYVQGFADGWDSRTAEAAFRELDDPYNLYVAASKYMTQIQQFLEHWAPEKLLLLDHVELLSNRAGTLRRVFRFIGVDEDFWSPRFDDMLNTREEKRRLSATHARLRGSPIGVASRRLPRPLRDPLRGPVRRALSEKVESPAIGAELRARLADLFADEVARLRAFTGERFAAWTV